MLQRWLNGNGASSAIMKLWDRFPLPTYIDRNVCVSATPAMDMEKHEFPQPTKKVAQPPKINFWLNKNLCLGVVMQ